MIQFFLDEYDKYYSIINSDDFINNKKSNGFTEWT